MHFFGCEIRDIGADAERPPRLVETEADHQPAGATPHLHVPSDIDAARYHARDRRGVERFERQQRMRVGPTTARRQENYAASNRSPRNTSTAAPRSSA